jgi:hypothetical protein
MNTIEISITPRAIQDLFEELEDSRHSRLRAWEALQKIRATLSDLGHIAIGPPARKTFEAEGAILDRTLAKVLRERNEAPNSLANAAYFPRIRIAALWDSIQSTPRQFSRSDQEFLKTIPLTNAPKPASIQEDKSRSYALWDDSEKQEPEFPPWLYLFTGLLDCSTLFVQFVNRLFQLLRRFFGSAAGFLNAR